MLAYKTVIPCTFLITQVELNKSENMIESTGSTRIKTFFDVHYFKLMSFFDDSL